MRQGIPYDSPQAVAICGATTAIMHGEAYATSAEIARDLGPFPGYARNREAMLRVMRNHRRAAYNAAPAVYEGLTIKPLGIDPSHCPGVLVAGGARDVGPGRHARRDATATETPRSPCLAPTGTIGLRDGLRHHRDRAGLRPGEVQEARRRRLLQDHQPEHPAGAARAGLPR